MHGYQAMADHYWQPRQSGGIDEAEIQQYQQAIQTALVNDIDTPSALAALSRLEATIDTSGISISCQEVYGNFIDWLDSVFGLRIRSDDITDEQKHLLEKRQEARSHEDWAQSDSLRGELLDQGLMVRDTDQGPIWSRRR